MVTRDYAKKIPRTPTYSRRPWLIGIAVLVLILAIPALFYAHYIHMPHFHKANIRVEPLIKPNQPHKHTPHVSSAQKEFDFYSMLPTISVDVKKEDANTLQVPDNQPYYLLQVATSSDKEAADVLVTKLGVMGLNAFTKTTASNNTTLYRIVVGPYLSKETADTDLAYLKTNHINGMELRINNYPKQKNNSSTL